MHQTMTVFIYLLFLWRCRFFRVSLYHYIAVSFLDGEYVLVRSPLLTSHKWRELVSSGRLVCRCHGIFSLVLRLLCFASFFVSMPRPFVQSSFEMQAFR